MQIKRFKAQDMTAALAQIKKEFGSDAVILSARDLRRRTGMLGVARVSGVEVTAAIDPASSGAAREQRVQGAASPAGSAGAVQDVVRIGSKGPLMRSLQSGMNVFRKRGETMTGRQRPEPAAETEETRHMARRLTAQGVAPDVVSKLTGNLRPAASTGKARRGSGLAGAMEALGLVDVPPGAAETDGIVVLTGPSGTGKTTTAIKMAAARAAQGARVGLITLDQHRIGAVAQLRVFADILRLPLEMAADATELADALERLADRDLIVVDTPGLSPRSAFQIHTLKSTLAALPAGRTLLALSATTKDEDLEEAVARYRGLGVDALVFTRTDESRRLGNVINLAVNTNLPVAYLSDGVRIPEDLRPATAQGLAELLLHPEAAAGAKPQRTEPRRTQRVNALPTEDAPAAPAVDDGGTPKFVANRNSDIFHRPDCKWTRVIKEENMVVFQSVEEARERRFSPCRYCSPVTVEAFRPISGPFQKKHAGGVR